MKRFLAFFSIIACLTVPLAYGVGDSNAVTITNKTNQKLLVTGNYHKGVFHNLVTAQTVSPKGSIKVKRLQNIKAGPFFTYEGAVLKRIAISETKKGEEVLVLKEENLKDSTIEQNMLPE